MVLGATSSRLFIAFGLFLLLGAVSCDSTDPDPSIDPDFDIQGHRGFRGLYPENGMLGFIKAIDAGVTTLELDIVVSKDSQLVVSHEATFSDNICSNPDGSPVLEAGEDTLNIYLMDLIDVQTFDCGLRGNADFPLQEKIATIKPSLVAVIDSVEAYTASQSLTSVSYNIEIKSSVAGDNLRHPEPDKFAELLIGVVDSLGVGERVSVQSFDERALQEVRGQDADLRVGYLVSDGDLADNLAILGFTPDYYSPNFTLVTEYMIARAHDRRMDVIPWTVNEQALMAPLIDLNVDGIITDYPDRLIALIEADYQ